MKNLDFEQEKYKIRKIHEAYIGFFLVTIIISLITVKFSDNQALVDRVNFAAAISSLILAVLAIVYAVYSTHSMNNSIASIVSAAATVGDSANRIFNASSEVSKNADKLSEATNALTEKIDNSQDLKDLKNNIIGMTQSKSSLTQRHNDTESTSYDDFLQKSSVIGHYSILIAIKSSEKNKEIDGTEIFGKLSISRDYAYGFIAAAASAGIIGTVSIAYPDKIKVSGNPAVTYESVKELTMKRINEIGANNPDQLKIIQGILTDIENMDI